MKLAEVEDVASRIMGASSIPGAYAELQRVVESAGFEASTYAEVSRGPGLSLKDPFYTTDLSRSFTSDYESNRFAEIDPVVHRALSSSMPFRWHDVPQYRNALVPRPGAKGKINDLCALARDHGYEDGFVIPCHGWKSQGTLISCLVSLYRVGKRPLTEPVPMWLRLACMVTHERILALREQADLSAEPCVMLTDREREVLTWAAAGKTTPETAAILAVSDRTVEFHVQNAMRKLGVHSKIHAVAVSIQSGLISI